MSVRGKTTPDSTPGSFSPVTGRVSRVEVPAETEAAPAVTINVSQYVREVATLSAASLTEQLARSRTRLADPNTTTDALVDHAHDAIAHDAALAVYTTASRIIDGGGNHQTLTDYAISGLCETPNDTYSGRRNDSRRVEHDARHKALTNILNAARNSPQPGAAQ